MSKLFASVYCGRRLKKVVTFLPMVTSFTFTPIALSSAARWTVCGAPVGNRRGVRAYIQEYHIPRHKRARVHGRSSLGERQMTGNFVGEARAFLMTKLL